MLSRSNILLTILLLAQVVLLTISVVISSGREARPVVPIAAGIAAADVEKFSFTDDLDNEVTFARRDDGWVLPGADDFPVDSDKIEEILDKIAGLDTRRLIASNPANFARLEVSDEDFRRKLSLESGAASSTLYLGGSGGVDTVYARRAGEDNVYLGVGLSSWELSTQTSTWVDANYVNVPLEDLLEISVENAEGRFAFARDGDSWLYTDLPAGEAFEDTKMPIVSRNAATIRLLEPLGLEALDEYELADPQAVVHVRYRQAVAPVESADEVPADEMEEPEAGAGQIEYTEEDYTLTFGASLEDGVVLKSSAADYHVLVRETVFNTFNDLKRADLIRAQELEGEAVAEGG